MGVPIETISQTLGHRSISTTQIYADITRTKINEDMTNLAERIEKSIAWLNNNISKDANINKYSYFCLYKQVKPHLLI